MSNQNDSLPDGLLFKKPHENAPEFVKGKLSVNKADFISYLNEQDGDWVNFDLKESKEGKYYAALDDWKPEGGSSPAPKGGSTAKKKLLF